MDSADPFAFDLRTLDSRPSEMPSDPSPAPLPARLSITDLVELDLPETSFVVPDLVPVGLGMLAAKPKIGKSWFGLNLALEIADGGTFLGKNVPKGDVLYIALEDNHRRLQARLHKLRPALNLPDGVEFWLKAPGIGPELIEEIAEWHDRVANPALVIIDTKGRLMPDRPQGQDDYTFTTRTLGALQQFALEHELGVLLIHHTRKSLGENADPFDQILGSTGIVGVMDAVLVLHRERNQHTGSLLVTGRDVEERSLDVTFDEGSATWRRHVPDPLAELAMNASEQLEVLKAVEAGHTSPSSIAGETGKERTNVQNLLDRLRERGLVEKAGYGRWHLTETAREQLGDGRDGHDSHDSSASADDQHPETPTQPPTPS